MNALTLNSLDDTYHFAKVLADTLQQGDVVLIKGDLGTGKSTLIREIIQYFCGKETDVPSPTFTLVQTYEAPQFEIWHMDLYRLEHPDEIYELGIEEAFETGVVFIEWPERLGRHTPKNHLMIEITQGQNNDERRITLTPTDSWRHRADALVS